MPLGHAEDQVKGRTRRGAPPAPSASEDIPPARSSTHAPKCATELAGLGDHHVAQRGIRTHGAPDFQAAERRGSSDAGSGVVSPPKLPLVGQWRGTLIPPTMSERLAKNAELRVQPAASHVHVLEHHVVIEAMGRLQGAQIRRVRRTNDVADRIHREHTAGPGQTSRESPRSRLSEGPERE